MRLLEGDNSLLGIHYKKRMKDTGILISSSNTFAHFFRIIGTSKQSPDHFSQHEAFYSDNYLCFRHRHRSQELQVRSQLLRLEFDENW